MSRHIGEDEHSTAAGNTGRAPEHVASPGVELSDGSPNDEVTRRDEFAEDGRWMPGTTRGGIPQDGSTPPHPSLLPLQSGRDLITTAQELPEPMPPPAKFLPTAEALLLAAISMFCSGTGAVLALGTDLAVNEATLDLLVRIRAAVRSLFDDAAMHAKLPPSGDAILDMEEAGGYLAAAVLGAGLLPSGDAARAIGEVVRSKADGAKGTAKKPGPLVTEPKRAALQAARDAKKAGLDEAATEAAVDAARSDARASVLSEVVDLKLERKRVVARPPSPDRLEEWCKRRGRSCWPDSYVVGSYLAYGVGGVQYRQALSKAQAEWVERQWKPVTVLEAAKKAKLVHSDFNSNDLCECEYQVR
jgi:hypothetical protein